GRADHDLVGGLDDRPIDPTLGGSFNADLKAGPDLDGGEGHLALADVAVDVFEAEPGPVDLRFQVDDAADPERPAILVGVLVAGIAHDPPPAALVVPPAAEVLVL